jgi:hypothetical protein
MRKIIDLAWVLPLLALAATAPGIAGQQQTPSPISNAMPTADFGFNLPSRLGTLSYSLSGSEFIETGDNTSTYESTALSGNFAYLSTSENDPFSMVYSGGYIRGNGGSAAENSTFQDLSFSQVIKARKWVFVASDALSYLPESPTTGLSGVAGVGDVGVYPVQTGLEPDQNILTYYGQRIGNGASGSATYQITATTDANASGSWQVLRFLGKSNPGYDSNAYSGTAGIDHRIDPLNTISVNANYSRQNYPGFAGTIIESDGVSLAYTRIWSRAISTTLSAGPERSHGEGFNNFAFEGISNFPSELNVAASATLNYSGRRTGGYVSYSRGVNGGSGTLFGAVSDVVTVGANRPLTRAWTFGVNGSYARDVSLAEFNNVQPVTHSFYGGVQISRRLSETLSCYGSYTAIDQSYFDLNSSFNIISGLNNIIGVGITFSPAPLHRGR